MKKIFVMISVLVFIAYTSVKAQQPATTTDIVNVGEVTFEKLVKYIEQKGSNDLTKSKDYYYLTYDYDDELNPRRCTFVSFNSLEEGIINVYVSSKKSNQIVSSFTITKKQLVFDNDDMWTLKLNRKFYENLLAEVGKLK